MTAGEGRALLGLSVYADDVRLGTVAGVLLDDRADHVLGVDVATSWGAGVRFLPWAAARLVHGAVHGDALSFLTSEETAFYERRGARRVTAAARGAGVSAASGRG